MRKILTLILVMILLAGCSAENPLSQPSAASSPASGGASQRAEGAPRISAASAILMEASTGQILYEKNSREKAWPASITKIMTALLAIESGDVKRKVRVDDSAVGVEGSSIYLKEKEILSMEDLLYGMMLRSGNDAAVAAAMAAEGSIPDFAAAMNLRAEELGALDTHFMNPSGLHHEDHYTTAHDMALIAREAMKNPVFREIAGAKEWMAKREGKDAYTFFENKNKVVFQYEGGNGIKLGYTTTAGRTLVASSCRDGLEVICVVLDDPNWFEDAYALMDYAHENWEMVKVLDGGGPLLTLPLKDGAKKQVFLGLSEDVYVPARKGEDLQCELQYDLPERLESPVNRWQEVGSLGIFSSEEKVLTVPVYCLEDIPKQVREE